jgi:hypothetical protein
MVAVLLLLCSVAWASEYYSLISQAELAYHDKQYECRRVPPIAFMQSEYWGQ